MNTKDEDEKAWHIKVILIKKNKISQLLKILYLSTCGKFPDGERMRFVTITKIRINKESQRIYKDFLNRQRCFAQTLTRVSIEELILIDTSFPQIDLSLREMIIGKDFS